MIIVALMAGDTDARRGILKDLIDRYKSRVCPVSVGYLPTVKSRLSRLSTELTTSRGCRRIYVVMDVKSPEEVALLRKKGAFFVHVYGDMRGPAYSHTAMQRTDLYIQPIPFRGVFPDHVMSPEDAIEECLHRFRCAKAPKNPRPRTA
ncbi:hypothetical protein A1OW_10365 [Enterovibrio norvegicus]|uniref:hypothetical protein n=1 Tax=Enterovibrio norvegicus TaxID=188144 RepID=UPI00031E681E|nr:hypothetical protein [Enterovibrio norvegicus]OEF50996.1 hypothetical protein A1OW_10365 [Enterovibrio norvegicus]